MEPPSFPTSGPRTLRAAPGGDATLILPLPSGSPPFRFEWTRAGAKLGDRFTTSDDAGGIRLTVSAAKTSDSGVYTLQASNAAGNNSTRLRLEVSPDEMPTGEDPPNFLRRLQDLTVKVGTRTRFLVEIVSSSECRVTWYRNERRLLEAERIALVRDGNFWCADISAVSVDDAGRWTCTAENVGGRASCSAHLNVLVPKAYKRPEFVDELRALLTEQGTVSLECKVVGVPTPVLRWFKDSREIKAGDVFALTANAEDPTSLGTYTCEAVNCMGRAYSSSKVHVVGRASREGSSRPSSGGVTPEPPPIFTKELEDHFVRICESLTLSCNIVVPPWPRCVVWYNKEGKIEASERYHILDDGVGGYLIEVPSAHWQDEGEWKCVATSAGGRVGISTCYVSMDVPKNYRKPRFMENLQAVLTEEGLVSFECKVVGFPTPVLSWFKDGQELKPGDVYQLTGTNSLGSYCCIARNCMGQASSSAELTVEDIQNQLNEEEKLQLFSKNQAPKFLQGLKSVEAKIDEPFRFTIKVAIPPEPTVLWYRDDQPVDESSRCHHGKEERGVSYLDIQNLEFMDQAEWKCVAMNDYGHSVTSCFLKLIIPRHYKKPRFLENLQAILSDEGAVNLECKVIGVPQPVLKWYKDGEELKAGDIHRIISGQDGTCCLGTYTCEAQNCMGIAASSASLLGFEDSMKIKNKKKADEQVLQRNLSLSTIQEERTSQMYDTPVGDITLDERGEISFSFDGKEVSVSLYETPDLTEEEALQIVEMYADQLSENITEHNVVELPPLRFIKETSTSGNLLMEAIIIDVSPEYFTSPEEDLRTEADIEDISIADENGPPQLSLDQEIDGEDYLEKTIALMSEEKADFPIKIDRKKSDSQKSADDYFSLSRDQSISDEKKDDESQPLSESDLQSFASARSSGKPKSKSSKPSIDDGQESSEVTKTVLLREELHNQLIEADSTIIKNNQQRRRSRSSRRSSSGSEKSCNKIKDNLVEMKLGDINKRALINQDKINSEITKINTSLTKIINDIQIIERDIIIKSELMSTAATASKSLEIINSLLTPLCEIHSITDSMWEIINEPSENIIPLLNRLSQPLETLQKSLTIVGKCIDVESDNKTLVKKSSLLIIDKCGSDLNYLLKGIINLYKEYYSIENFDHSNLENITTELLCIINDSVDILNKNKRHDAEIDANASEISKESKYLHETQKTIYDLKSSLKSVLHVLNKVDVFKPSIFSTIKKNEIILNEISVPIQDLQTALEHIETLSVIESKSNLQNYNTEIIETIMDSILQLRTSFKQLSEEVDKKENTYDLNQNLSDIKLNINEILLYLNDLELKTGKFDVLYSENKLEVLQKMAQILITLENNIPLLDSMPSIKTHMSEFHRNLTKILENVIESEDSRKYFDFLEICDSINRISSSLKSMNSNSMLSLANISNTLKIVKESIDKNIFQQYLSQAVSSNIIYLLASIESLYYSPEKTAQNLDLEIAQNLSIKKDEVRKVDIVLEHIEQTVAALSAITPHETVKDFILIQTLNKICPILEDLKCNIANNIQEAEKYEKTSDIESLSCTESIAHQVYELNQTINVFNEILYENTGDQERVQLISEYAKPLIELSTTLQILQQDIISQCKENVSYIDISTNIANVIESLQSCLMIQEQQIIEAVDDMSTLEDISGIKSNADISYDALATATIEEMTCLRFSENVSQLLPSTSVKVLLLLDNQIKILQNPEYLELLSSVLSLKDHSIIKSLLIELSAVSTRIQAILETSSDIPYLTTSSLKSEIILPLQEIEQKLSVIAISNITTLENVSESTKEKLSFLSDTMIKLKNNLVDCLGILQPSIEFADFMIDVSNKIANLKSTSEKLNNFIDYMITKSSNIPININLINLKQSLSNFLRSTSTPHEIKISQLKDVIKNLYITIIVGQDDLIQFTAQRSETMMEESMIMEMIIDIENIIASLEKYNLLDMSHSFDVLYEAIPLQNTDTITNSFMQINEDIEDTLDLLQTLPQDLLNNHIITVKDFCERLKKDMVVLRYLIEKPPNSKRLIKLLQVFYTLRNRLKDFKSSYQELTLPDNINKCLWKLSIDGEESLKHVQLLLTEVVESHSDILFGKPFSNINTIEASIGEILGSDQSYRHQLLKKFLNIIIAIRPSFENLQSSVIQELYVYPIKDPESTLTEGEAIKEFELFKTFVLEKLDNVNNNDPQKDTYEKILNVIEKHEDYKDAIGSGKKLIFIKCISDCSVILKQKISEISEQDVLQNNDGCENILRLNLKVLKNCLEKLYLQLQQVPKQNLTEVEKAYVTLEIKSTELEMCKISKSFENILDTSSDTLCLSSTDISTIMELDNKIRLIKDASSSLESIEHIKSIGKSIDEVEITLRKILLLNNDVGEQNRIFKEKTAALLQHMEQYIEIIEIVEEVSAVIKLDELKESANKVRELMQSIKVSEAEETSKEPSIEIKLNIDRFGQKLQESFMPLQAQSFEYLQEFAPSINEDIRQKIIKVVSDLQNDLIALTGTNIFLQENLTTPIAQVKEQEKKLDDLVNTNISLKEENTFETTSTPREAEQSKEIQCDLMNEIDNQSTFVQKTDNEDDILNEFQSQLSQSENDESALLTIDNVKPQTEGLDKNFEEKAVQNTHNNMNSKHEESLASIDQKHYDTLPDTFSPKPVVVIDVLVSHIREYVSDDTTAILDKLLPPTGTENLKYTVKIAKQLYDSMLSKPEDNDPSFQEVLPSFSVEQFELVLSLYESLSIMYETTFEKSVDTEVIMDKNDLGIVKTVVNNLRASLQTIITTVRKSIDVEVKTDNKQDSKLLGVEEENKPQQTTISTNVCQNIIFSEVHNIPASESSIIDDELKSLDVVESAKKELAEPLNEIKPLKYENLPEKVVEDFTELKESSTQQIISVKTNITEITEISCADNKEKIEVTKDNEENLTSLQTLANLFQDANDMIDLTSDTLCVDNSESLQNTFDEVQTVIMKIKYECDDAIRDTYNETLEDLECNVRSVQLQINEHSPSVQLKEACANLLMLLTYVGEIDNIEKIEKLESNTLYDCASNADESIGLLEKASCIKTGQKMESIISNLNNIKETMKFIKSSFGSDTEALIIRGIDVIQGLNQIEDRIFCLEKDIDSEKDIDPETRDSIISAVHSVYGSISNMRGAISSIQKKYMYENYGSPSRNFLKSIKNIMTLSKYDSRPYWKDFARILRKVLNHFEDIKFYINFDKTARLPSDAAFTKIILSELHTMVSAVVQLHISHLDKDVSKCVQNCLNCVSNNLNDLENKTTLEVKDKIPIFKNLSENLLDYTLFLKSEMEKNITEVLNISETKLQIDLDISEKSEILTETEISNIMELAEGNQSNKIIEEKDTQVKIELEKNISQEENIPITKVFTETANSNVREQSQKQSNQNLEEENEVNSNGEINDVDRIVAEVQEENEEKIEQEKKAMMLKDKEKEMLDTQNKKSGTIESLEIIGEKKPSEIESESVTSENINEKQIEATCSTQALSFDENAKPFDGELIVSYVNDKDVKNIELLQEDNKQVEKIVSDDGENILNEYENKLNNGNDASNEPSLNSVEHKLETGDDSESCVERIEIERVAEAQEENKEKIEQGKEIIMLKEEGNELFDRQNKKSHAIENFEIVGEQELSEIETESVTTEKIKEKQIATTCSNEDLSFDENEKPPHGDLIVSYVNDKDVKNIELLQEDNKQVENIVSDDGENILNEYENKLNNGNDASNEPSLNSVEHKLETGDDSDSCVERIEIERVAEAQEENKEKIEQGKEIIMLKEEGNELFDRQNKKSHAIENFEIVGEQELSEIETESVTTEKIKEKQIATTCSNEDLSFDENEKPPHGELIVSYVNDKDVKNIELLQEDKKQLENIVSNDGENILNEYENKLKNGNDPSNEPSLNSVEHKLETGNDSESCVERIEIERVAEAQEENEEKIEQEKEILMLKEEGNELFDRQNKKSHAIENFEIVGEQELSEIETESVTTEKIKEKQIATTCSKEDLSFDENEKPLDGELIVSYVNDKDVKNIELIQEDNKQVENIASNDGENILNEYENKLKNDNDASDEPRLNSVEHKLETGDDSESCVERIEIKRVAEAQEENKEKIEQGKEIIMLKEEENELFDRQNKKSHAIENFEIVGEQELSEIETESVTTEKIKEKQIATTCSKEDLSFDENEKPLDGELIVSYVNDKDVKNIELLQKDNKQVENIVSNDGKNILNEYENKLKNGNDASTEPSLNSVEHKLETGNDSESCKERIQLESQIIEGERKDLDLDSERSILEYAEQKELTRVNNKGLEFSQNDENIQSREQEKESSDGISKNLVKMEVKIEHFKSDDLQSSVIDNDIDKTYVGIMHENDLIKEDVSIKKSQTNNVMNKEDTITQSEKTLKLEVIEQVDLTTQEKDLNNEDKSHYTNCEKGVNENIVTQKIDNIVTKDSSITHSKATDFKDCIEINTEDISQNLNITQKIETEIVLEKPFRKTEQIMDINEQNTMMSECIVENKKLIQQEQMKKQKETEENVEQLASDDLNIFDKKVTNLRETSEKSITVPQTEKDIKKLQLCSISSEEVVLKETKNEIGEPETKDEKIILQGSEFIACSTFTEEIELTKSKEVNSQIISDKLENILIEKQKKTCDPAITQNDNIGKVKDLILDNAGIILPEEDYVQASTKDTTEKIILQEVTNIIKNEDFALPVEISRKKEEIKIEKDEECLNKSQNNFENMAEHNVESSIAKQCINPEDASIKDLPKSKISNEISNISIEINKAVSVDFPETSYAADITETSKNKIISEEVQEMSDTLRVFAEDGTKPENLFVYQNTDLEFKQKVRKNITDNKEENILCIDSSKQVNKDLLGLAKSDEKESRQFGDVEKEFSIFQEKEEKVDNIQTDANEEKIIDIAIFQDTSIIPQEREKTESYHSTLEDKKENEFNNIGIISKENEKNINQNDNTQSIPENVCDIEKNKIIQEDINNVNITDQEFVTEGYVKENNSTKTEMTEKLEISNKTISREDIKMEQVIPQKDSKYNLCNKDEEKNVRIKPLHQEQDDKLFRESGHQTKSSSDKEEDSKRKEQDQFSYAQLENTTDKDENKLKNSNQHKDSENKEKMQPKIIQLEKITEKELDSQLKDQDLHKENNNLSEPEQLKCAQVENSIKKKINSKQESDLDQRIENSKQEQPNIVSEQIKNTIEKEENVLKNQEQHSHEIQIEDSIKKENNDKINVETETIKEKKRTKKSRQKLKSIEAVKKIELSEKDQLDNNKEETKQDLREHTTEMNKENIKETSAIKNTHIGDKIDEIDTKQKYELIKEDQVNDIEEIKVKAEDVTVLPDKVVTQEESNLIKNSDVYHETCKKIDKIKQTDQSEVMKTDNKNNEKLNIITDQQKHKELSEIKYSIPPDKTRKSSVISDNRNVENDTGKTNEARIRTEQKIQTKESPAFIDCIKPDYGLEFPRPSNYVSKSFDVEDTVSLIKINNKSSTMYKTQTLLYESQLRSTLPPHPRSSEGRTQVKDITKSSSESRSTLSENRTTITRDTKRKPVFSTYLTDRTAVESSRVKLTCSILSPSDPTITWYKNGVVLDNNQKFRSKFVEGLITLEVLNAVPSDSGEYSCTVQNENGCITSSANLKVYPSFEASPIPPTFTRSIRDIYHLAENELVLECRIRGQPLPAITWLKNDEPIVSNERVQAYYLADGVCRLTISSPTSEDSGKYTCKAENSIWSDQISHNVYFTDKKCCVNPNIVTLEKVHLNRQAMESRRPHFTNVLSDHKVVTGGTIGLQVEIRGDPTRVEWLREERSVTELYRNAQTYVEHDIYTLALSDVTEKESGLYTCRAWSSHGKVDMNASITVVQANSIEGKPATIVSRPNKDLLISVGADLNISFRVQGEPKPKVFFMKGMRDITNSLRVCKMTSDDYVKFTLKRSVVSDAGTYCIFARNAYGCDRAFVTIVIRQRASSDSLISDWTYPVDDLAISSVDRNYKSVPDRIPSEPTAVDGGNNWVSLAWPKPDVQERAPILAYKIESWLLGKEGGARWIEMGITPRNSFDVFNVKQGEEYHFRVTPRNRYGWGESVQTSVPIGIGLAGDRPEFTEILPGQLKVLLNETAVLSCSFKGKPTPEILWMKNGHEIEEERGRITLNIDNFNTSLSINEVKIEDEGRYSCEARNIHGRSSTYARMAVITDRHIWEADAKLKRERSAGIDGEYPPQFTMRLRDRRVQATYPVRLTCQVVGNPPPVLTWFKNGHEISMDGRHVTSQDEYFHTLEIAPTSLEDGGVYEAMARNCYGAVSCRCSLVVDKGIRAYIAPEFCCGLEPLYHLNEGDELRISAIVEAYPSVGVTWYRDGVRLRPSRRAIMTLDRDGQIELALASVTGRDAGVYTCTASNEVGRASTSGKVEVVYGDSVIEKPLRPSIIISPDVPYSKEPMFIRKPRSSEAREGDTVIIECEVIGDPKPDVYWLRDFLKPDYYRDASHFKRVGAGPAYRFEIPHAKFDYTGAYSIIAKNIHGEAKAIISLQILAKDPSAGDDVHNIRFSRVEVIPHIDKELTDLLCYDGDAVEFECRVSGNPEPDIRWFYYNEIVPDCLDFESSFDLGTARLKIKQVTAEDEGTYRCEASNSLGKASSSACLVVYPPGEPNTLSQRLRRPPALLSAASTPRSTPRTTPARSMSRTPGPDLRRLSSPTREVAPKFYTYPFNRVAEEGDTIVFQCAVKGLPPPWATWDKDGIIITPSARFSIKEKDETYKILEIEQVTIDDVGLYRITLENDYGRAEASARLEVITQKGKFYGTTRSYSVSPRKSLPYRRRTPSFSKQD